MALTQRLAPSQGLAQRQGLALTPQLAQSIKLLAMSQTEIEAFVREQALANPLVQVRPRGIPSPANRTATVAGENHWEHWAEPVSLASHLHHQITLAAAPRPVAQLAKLLASDLSPEGLLEEPARTAREHGYGHDVCEAALALLRGLDPAGVGARDLGDCLALQLARTGRLDPAMEALTGDLSLVARGDCSAMMRASGLDADDLDDALAELRALDPRPGLRFAEASVAPSPPDVLMVREERGGWRVELNEETLPRAIADRDYHARISERARNSHERDYLAKAWADANWLVRALHQRAQTVLKVAEALVRAQDAFFEHGVQALQPLTMASVAETIDMHESTVSRVVTAKTIDTPAGMLPLRFFFSAAIRGTNGQAHSAKAVQDRIRTLVATEGADILSDDAIVARLRSDGVEIARRTVAKYRGALAIPSSSERRRRVRSGPGVKARRIAAAVAL